MEALRVIRERSIRFFFLGNIETDRRVKNFIRYFKSRGWTTELVCSTTSTNIPSDLVKELGASVHHLKRSGGPMMFYEHNQYLKNLVRTLPATDVTVACDLYSLGAARYAKLRKQSLYVAYDAREVYTGLPSVVGKPLSRWFWKWFEHRGLKATDAILVTGTLDAVAIEKVHGFLPKNFLIRNIPMRPPKAQRNNYLRERFNIDPAKSIFVYVGGIQRDRGLGQMVNAMSELRDEGVFIMIGDGALREGLQSVVQNAELTDAVYFHDAIASERVLSVLASADVGIVLVDTDAPSYALALPSKMYEYLFAGLPVLASPMKQAMTEFAGNPAVRFVKLHDQADIVNGTRDLLALSRNAQRREEVQDKAIESFSFEHDAAQFADFLEGILT